MRYLTLNIAENLQLSIDNSMTGVETIYINEEEVSKKFSFWGANHVFTRNENGETINYQVKIGLSFTGIGYNIYRNDAPILISNGVSKLNNFSWFDVAAYTILFFSSMGLSYYVTSGILRDDFQPIPLGISVFAAIASGSYFFWRKAKNAKK